MLWKAHELKERLDTEAKKKGLHISQVQLLLAQERFLARVASSKEGKHFIWKGGSLILRLYSSGIAKPRYTVDLDLMAQGYAISELNSYFRRVMAIDLNDGFHFFNCKRTFMVRETPYGGERYTFDWRFFKTNQSDLLRVDVCAGDVVKEEVVLLNDAFLLKDNSSLEFRIYPPEFILAEKLETMVRFRQGNTRLKDFIDMWTLHKMGMSSTKAKYAIERCFERRKIVLEPNVWQKVLTDQDFIDVMEKRKVRLFKDLGLPSMKRLFKELSDYLSKIYR